MGTYYCLDCEKPLPEGATYCPYCGRKLYSSDPARDLEKPLVDPKKLRLCFILEAIGFAIILASAFIPFYKVQLQEEVEYITLFEQGALGYILGAMLGLALAGWWTSKAKKQNFENSWIFMGIWGAMFYSAGNFVMSETVIKMRPWYGALVYFIGIIFIMVADSVYKRALKAAERKECAKGDGSN